MTIFQLENKQIPENGICPEIPEGTTEVDLSNCSNLKEITNIPSSVKKLNLESCEKLKTLPQLPDSIEDIDLSYCYDLEEITNIPSSVKKLLLDNCEKLKALPQIPDGIEEISLSSFFNLKEITNIPSSVKKLNLDYCAKLKTLPQIPDSIEEINLSHCHVLEEITNIPSSVKKLNLDYCVKLKTLPQLQDGIEEISLSHCHDLEEITNIPSSVKKLNLDYCAKLKFTIELITKLAGLEEQECVVIYPQHFNLSALSDHAKVKLDQIAKSYLKQNPRHPDFPNIKNVLNRFLNEGIGQRSDKNTTKSRATEIAKSTLPTLNILEKNPHLLPLLEEVSTSFLAGCVNQPVRAWSEVSALMAITSKENINDQLESSKQLFTLDYIAGYVRELKQNEVGEMFEAEAGNALYREVHKKLLAEQNLDQPWLGVPGPISYEASIKNFLTEERIQEAVKNIREEIFSLTKEQLAEKICESQHNQSWGEICFPNELRAIKESHSKRREELAEKTSYTEEEKKELKEIDFNLKSELSKKTKEATFTQLNPKNSEVKEEEKEREEGKGRKEEESKNKSTRANNFRTSVKKASEGFGRDVFDPRIDNILTRNHQAFNTPTAKGLRPSQIQHGDTKQPTTTFRKISATKKLSSKPDLTRG
jgi:hypothetical protein